MTPLLLEALNSGNLERAYRAEQLLDAMDPTEGHFYVIKVRLGDKPSLATNGYARARPGEEFAIQPNALPPQSRDASTGGGASLSSFRYAVVFSARDRQQGQVELDIHVARSRRGYGQRDPLNRPVPSPSAISLLALTEECHYRRFGLWSERERQRYVTLLRVRYGRASELSGVELPSEPGDLLAQLVEELKAQTRSEAPRACSSAIEILSYLARGEAEAVFTGALDDAALRPAAVLGLDRGQLLQQLVSSESETAGTTGGKLPSPGVRAAVRLLEQGEDAPLAFLLDRLSQDNPEHFHFIMASVADHIDSHSLSPETRRRIVSGVFSDGFFTHAVWQNLETAYFVDRVSSLVDPDLPSDRRAIEVSLARLEGMVQGRFGPTRISLDVCLPVWRRLASRLAPRAPSECEMLFRLLPSLAQYVPAHLLRRRIEESLKERPLSRTELASLARVLDPQNPQSALQILSALDSLQMQPGQLRLVVGALIELADQLAVADPAEARKNRVYVTQVVDRLERLTGVVAQGARGAELTTWKRWLEDDEAVLRQEGRLLDRRGSGGAPLWLIEFDIAVEDLHNSVSGAASEFEILDGRRIEVTEGEPFSYVDRWGNVVRRRLEAYGGGRRGASARGGDRRRVRYRFGNSSTLSIGVPALVPISGRDVTSAWFETSPFFLGSRSLSRRRPGYRSLVLLLENAEFPMLEPAAEAGSGSPRRDGVHASLSPEATAELWKSVVERYIFVPPEVSSPSLEYAVTRILRALRIEGDTAVLSRLFERRPDHHLARDLFARGSRQGIDYYEERLDELTGIERLNAAQLLAEVGERVGVDAILSSKLPAAAELTGFRALDRYLATPEVSASDRDRVLGFLVERLRQKRRHTTALNAIFTVFRRELGDDFGWTEAQGMNDAREKNLAVQKAIDAAEAWWGRHSQPPSERSRER